MRLATKNTKAVLEKLFGKSLEEHLKSFPSIARNYRNYDLSERAFGLTVHTSAEGLSSTVVVGFKDLVNILKFTIEYYPACCGSRLFHHFTVSDHLITQEQLNEVMDTFFQENVYDVKRNELGVGHVNYTSCALGGANRIEVMMVEQRRIGADVSTLSDIEPVENPQICYKSLWNFFHKYAKRVRTRLEYNPNSGNVLHNMEVIL